MAKFKLLSGAHGQWEEDENGERVHRYYEAGQIVESDEDLAAKLGKDRFELVEGKPKPLEATSPTAKPAETPKPPEHHADSSVADLNAEEAIDHISRMRSRERLEEIVAHDSRVTVQRAARERLESLGDE